MKLNDQQKAQLKQLDESGFIPALLEELTNDTNLAWTRADTKDKREEFWHLTRAIRKLSAKFDLIFQEARKP